MDATATGFAIGPLRLRRAGGVLTRAMGASRPSCGLPPEFERSKDISELHCLTVFVCEAANRGCRAAIGCEKGRVAP